LFQKAQPIFAAKQEAEKAKAEETEKKGETVDASFTEVDTQTDK
jgi:hypothetical protein